MRRNLHLAFWMVMPQLAFADAVVGILVQRPADPHRRAPVLHASMLRRLQHRAAA